MANGVHGRAGPAHVRVGVTLVALAVAVIGVIVASGPRRPAGAATAVTVRIDAAGLVPQQARAEVGGTVVWVNAAGTTLSVVASDASFNSGPLDPGEQFQFAFTEARTVSYTVPEVSGASGTIVVAAAVPAPPSVPAAATSQFAYTGSATAFNGVIGGALLALGAGLLISAQRFGLAGALTGLPFAFVPDDILPTRRHRRLSSARARRSGRR